MLSAFFASSAASNSVKLSKKPWFKFTKMRKEVNTDHIHKLKIVQVVHQQYKGSAWENSTTCRPEKVGVRKEIDGNEVSGQVNGSSYNNPELY